MSISLPTFEVTLVGQHDGNVVTQSVQLTDIIKHSNKGLILYFYPKDNTPGCTIQAIDFTNELQAFTTKGYTVIGVSRDSIKSHENFITKQALNIALISDTDERLCQHFDVIKEKQLYGKTHLGVVRSTFVFDKTGTLIHELRNVTAKTHIKDLLALL
ncbi:MAG: peroxiredoxin [Moraxella sp.]|nr:peroxiredoxin [Moraxella sp.]